MSEKFRMKAESEPEKEKTKQKELREYAEALRPLARVFSGYGFYELKIDPNISSFAFDHRNKEIILSTRLVESLNLEKEEQKYVFLHEIGHLIQLLQDPDSYLESFEIPKEKAEKEPPEYKEPIENAWHNFFNTFLDIHSNSIVRALMPIYQRGGKSENLPKILYSQKIFSEKNYSESILSTQFLNYLLRKTMVPEEGITISREVKDKIEEKIDFFGREYASLEEFVREEIFNPEKTIKDQIFLLKEFLAPVYQEFLEKDKESGRIEEVPEFIGDFPVDGDISEEAVKEIAKEIKERKKSPDEKYQENLRKKTEKKLRDKGFSEEEIQRIQEIKETTFKVINNLEDIWRNFIQKSTELAREKIVGFKRGTSVSPEKLLSELPVLLTNPLEAEIFTRDLPVIESEAIKPKRINLELIVDLSGSMDEEKRKAVQEVAYAINKSLINFYRTGSLSVVDQKIEFPVSINYRILGFGDSVQELTQTTEEEKKERVKKDRPNKDLDEELLKAILKIEKIDLGATQDDKALALVEQEITPDVEEKLKSGDEVLVVLEITDGETQTKEKSKFLVEKLNSIPNVYCRAIQIPGPIYSEKPTSPEIRKEEKFKPLTAPKILAPTGIFKYVWSEQWGKKLENLGILKETVLAILYDALKYYL